MEARQWSVEQVCAWLGSVGLGQAAPRFQTAAIDGPMLAALDGGSRGTKCRLQ
jgi:hypothetical protein